jgi:hypothetical protein
MVLDEEEHKALSKVEPQQAAGTTLLPSPFANAVSLVTRSSSLYIRLGTFIGGLALDGARVTTLTGLELSRALIESILHRAGNDVATRSTGELGRAEAEGLLERSIATLHSTITSISFAASTGFYISTVALESATDISQQLLGMLDSILGSTDSSRAIASIITLIRREFDNPATGQQGEKVSVADLLIGICGLALLQRWCKKLTDTESQERKYEEVLWDVVILDNGRRVDVVNEGSNPNEDSEMNTSQTFITKGNDLLETIERGEIVNSDDEAEINLRQIIMQSLPADASVSITTSTMTTKTITVEITGTQPPDMSPPPGVEIIEETAHHTGGEVSLSGSGMAKEQNLGLLIPRYRVVYRIANNKTHEDGIAAISDAEGFMNVEDNGKIVSGSSKDSASPKLESPPLPSLEVDGPPELPQKESKSTSTFPIPKSALLSDEKDPNSSSHLPEEHVPNQKRSRQPMSATSSISGSETHPRKALGGKSLKKLKSEKPLIVKATTERKGTFREALKKGSGSSISNLWNKDQPTELPQSKVARPSWGAPTPPPKPLRVASQRKTTILSDRDAPRPPQRGNPNYFTSRDLGLTVPDTGQPSPSLASFYSIHEQRRDSIVSQTDTYSIHSFGSRPASPTTFRTHMRAHSSVMQARSEKNISSRPPSPHGHRRSKSVVPSIYTLNASNSATSLVLTSHPQPGAFEDSNSLEFLMQSGHVDGLFPQHHIVRNMTRFIRFASASYGASFLRVMGIATSSTKSKPKEFETNHHHEHHSFSNHTQLPPSTILLSSFVDPEGGTDATGHTGTGVPMVHFVSLDHDSKAVVLTCRGTLGFEDVLTDMTCDYDEITYHGKCYKAHMGIHASAKRLLSSRVLVTIKAALEEFPDYGLVLCGHSLGGAVTAVLAIMISEPCSTGTAFITSSGSYEKSQLLLPSSSDPGTAPEPQSHLPPGRPIHVYAYGPPASISPSLRLATRGLITSVVNGQDLVPYLSLGVLHDLQAVALAFKNDDSGAKGEVRKRVWEGLQGSFRDKWYQNGAGAKQREEDDQWAYASLKTLRASMLSSKLVPPGEVFIVESMPVLRRDGFVKEDQGLGSPATRSVLKYVRDVEKRFGEVRFGGNMLMDHSPGRYEASLGALGRGVLESI